MSIYLSSSFDCSSSDLILVYSLSSRIRHNDGFNKYPLTNDLSFEHFCWEFSLLCAISSCLQYCCLEINPH
jgi:hypothetical protein